MKDVWTRYYKAIKTNGDKLTLQQGEVIVTVTNPATIKKWFNNGKYFTVKENRK
jgi:hypothetical protein